MGYMVRPRQYVKRPVIIEAMQWGEGLGAAERHTITAWMEHGGYLWLRGNALEPDTLEPKGEPGIWIDPADGHLVIRTLEGDMKVGLGDWIIRGVLGEFYPCKPAIFAATYDEAPGVGE